MFTSGELERASMFLDEPMKELEMRIMQDVVRRIKINGEITAAADWQINRLQQLGMSQKEVNAAIQEALNYSDEDMNELYSKVIGAGYARDAELYKATGTPFVPFEENNELQQLISSVSDQTNQTLHNITQSLGFAERGTNGKISFTPLADFYQKTLDSAMLDISSGAFDYNTVLKRTVKAMTDSGLRTVDYASGHSNRVDVAARRAVMTGMTQLTAKVNEDNAEQLGTDMFEVSWHGGARPEHQVWQGKWYTKEQLKTVCGLGTVTGLCGANCYHEYNPVIPGISEPTYTAEELEELNRQENEHVEWKGKQYTKYEALQRQRRLETTMRAQRQEMALLKKGEADEDDLINCRAKYWVTSAEYTRFSETMGLPQQRERVSADGLGNIMQGKYTKGSGKPSPVQVPAVGAKVTNKVTAEERKELLSRNPVNVHNSSVDKSGESGIISGRGSGKKPYISENHTYEKIGEIDFSDKKAIARSLQEFEHKYIDSDIEHCRVFCPNGEVYEVHGDRFRVNTDLLGDKMEGSINEHNHVIGESQYSFSWEDLESSAKDKSHISMAYDEKFRYSMTFPDAEFTEDIVYEAYKRAEDSVGNDLKFYPERVPIGDEQHERIKRACKELGIKYSRVPR